MAETDPTADPSAIARLGRLELVARLAVEGAMAGLHRSPFKGSSVEFAGHRRYGPGDEIRHIDWRAYGKTDRYFVKEFEERTNLAAYLVVDNSASMGFTGGGGRPSKLEQARRLAASLAFLLVGQRDAVGLVVSGTAHDPTATVFPGASVGQVASLCRALEGAEPSGSVALARAVEATGGRLRRRGLFVLLSDGFEPLEPLTLALRHLRRRHHEVLFFHILAPEEEEFPYRGPTRFRDLETPGRRVETAADPSALRRRYLERFRAFCLALRGSLREMGADYHRVSTAEPVERALLDYLAARTRRGRGGPRTPPGAG